MPPSYSGFVSHLASRYVVTPTQVSWGSHPLEKVDAGSFKEYAPVWGADDKTVFIEWRPRRIDRTTFRFLNPVFVCDETNVYDYHGIVEGADPRTFQCLDSGLQSSQGKLVNESWIRGYGKDAGAVYYHDQLTGKASALRSAKPDGFVSFGNRYGSDGTTVYFEKSRLPNADPATWLHLGNGYSADARTVYYFNRPVPQVSRSSFKVILVPDLFGNYATDGKVFLRNDSPIPEAEFDKEITRAIGTLQSNYRVFKQNHQFAPPTGRAQS
jgi:hypothetical protein